MHKCIYEKNSWDKTMADKLMYIPNVNALKYLLWSLQLNKSTNLNSLKVPKVVKPLNKKT